MIPRTLYHQFTGKTPGSSSNNGDHLSGTVQGHGQVNHIEIGEGGKVTIRPNQGVTATQHDGSGEPRKKLSFATIEERAKKKRAREELDENEDAAVSDEEKDDEGDNFIPPPPPQDPEQSPPPRRDEPRDESRDDPLLFATPPAPSKTPRQSQDTPSPRKRKDPTPRDTSTPKTDLPMNVSGIEALTPVRRSIIPDKSWQQDLESGDEEMEESEESLLGEVVSPPPEESFRSSARSDVRNETMSRNATGDLSNKSLSRDPLEVSMADAPFKHSFDDAMSVPEVITGMPTSPPPIDQERQGIVGQLRLMDNIPRIRTRTIRYAKINDGISEKKKNKMLSAIARRRYKAHNTLFKKYNLQRKTPRVQLDIVGDVVKRNVDRIMEMPTGIKMKKVAFAQKKKGSLGRKYDGIAAKARRQPPQDVRPVVTGMPSGIKMKKMAFTQKKKGSLGRKYDGIAAKARQQPPQDVRPVTGTKGKRRPGKKKKGKSSLGLKYAAIAEAAKRRRKRITPKALEELVKSALDTVDPKRKPKGKIVRARRAKKTKPPRQLNVIPEEDESMSSMDTPPRKQKRTKRRRGKSVDSPDFKRAKSTLPQPGTFTYATRGRRKREEKDFIEQRLAELEGTGSMSKRRKLTESESEDDDL